MSFVRIKGKPIDNATRCIHYRSEKDIIAIKFKCCNEFYPCYSCHEETAGHPAQVWEKELFDEKAVRCGLCGYIMTISEYMNCGDACPSCEAQFNPNCANHYHYYFEQT